MLCLPEHRHGCPQVSVGFSLLLLFLGLRSFPQRSLGARGWAARGQLSITPWGGALQEAFWGSHTRFMPSGDIFLYHSSY